MISLPSDESDFSTSITVLLEFITCIPYNGGISANRKRRLRDGYGYFDAFERKRQMFYLLRSSFSQLSDNRFQCSSTTFSCVKERRTCKSCGPTVSTKKLYQGKITKARQKNLLAALAGSGSRPIQISYHWRSQGSPGAWPNTLTENDTSGKAHKSPKSLSLAGLGSIKYRAQCNDHFATVKEKRS